MSPTAIPTRITIDFRDAMHPSRTWILGLGAEPTPRVEILALEHAQPGRRLPLPAALDAECACPEFCERDHANE